MTAITAIAKIESKYQIVNAVHKFKIIRIFKRYCTFNRRKIRKDRNQLISLKSL